MFKRQTQVMDFNQLMAQMIEGERAKIVVDRIEDILTQEFKQRSASFNEKISEGAKESKIYSWEYPFQTFTDSYDKIAQAMVFEPKYENAQQLSKDIAAAKEFNKAVEENLRKKQEENDEG